MIRIFCDKAIELEGIIAPRTQLVRQKSKNQMLELHPQSSDNNDPEKPELKRCYTERRITEKMATFDKNAK